MATVLLQVMAAAVLLRLPALAEEPALTEAPAPAEESTLPTPQGEVLLEVHGAVGRTNGDGVARFDRAMLEALPRAQLDTGTSVTDGVHHFEGVLMRDLLASVQVHGRTVVATALNDYVMTFDIAEFDRYDVLAAWSMDGNALQPSDKGPLWIIYPRNDYRELQDIRYDYRWVWQLVRLDVQ